MEKTGKNTHTYKTTNHRFTHYCTITTIQTQTTPDVWLDDTGLKTLGDRGQKGPGLIRAIFWPQVNKPWVLDLPKIFLVFVRQ